MPDTRSGSGDSGLEVSGPLSLGSISPSAPSPIKERKPALERHISHIPQDSDEEEPEDSSETSRGLKPKLKRLRDRVSHSSKKKSEATIPSAEKRHDSGNATSDFEITPGMSLGSNDHTDSADYRTKAPILERHISSIGPDGHLEGTPCDKPRGRSPNLERHISGIPQQDD